MVIPEPRPGIRKNWYAFLMYYSTLEGGVPSSSLYQPSRTGIIGSDVGGASAHSKWR